MEVLIFLKIPALYIYILCHFCRRYLQRTAIWKYTRVAFWRSTPLRMNFETTGRGSRAVDRYVRQEGASLGGRNKYTHLEQTIYR